MTRHLNLTPNSPVPAPTPLVAVDRAVAELRRGGIVALQTGHEITYVLAAEAIAVEALAELASLAGNSPQLAVTIRRATVLGLLPDGVHTGVIRLSSARDLSPEVVAWLADPCARGVIKPDLSGIVAQEMSPASGAAAAVGLAKLARLLPAAVIAESLIATGGQSPLLVTSDDILTYQQTAARTLRIVSEARVPLKDAENARIVAFRPSDGGIEHLAIVIGEPDPDQPVLARLHSECFTGDLLGSLRCDCGDQLRGAIGEIAQTGNGILLYLAQEGRGIGLVNKLRAYNLQDEGFDTLDANLQLGFDDDERIYQPAAQMLRLLGIGQIRLMTNNPNKVEALRRHGVAVDERVPHVFPANDHNEAYLRTKATRSGHLF